MSITVVLTGASGTMGTETIRQVLELPCVEKVKLLLLNERRERRYAKKWKKRYGARVEIAFGDVAKEEDCLRLVEGSDYLLHLAAVIPPKADHYYKKADECNRLGTINLVNAVRSLAKQPKFVHISTVAVYGDRNGKHPWGRVGDPLLPSAYDEYAETKIKGERYLLDAELSEWVVLRQTGILYGNMLMANIGDGLMFHTCHNVPIEWVTAKDSGLLLKRIIERDAEGSLAPSFWKKCYNIGGGATCRVTGYETFDRGFKMIGGSTKSFMKPNWNATRNFHCMWFEDSHVLNDLFDFQQTSFEAFWRETERTHKVFSLARIVPAKLISALVFKPLLRNNNAPIYWLKQGLTGRVVAAFGSEEAARALPEKWEDFPLLCEDRAADGSYVDYRGMSDESKVVEHGYRLDHGYDESKSDDELDVEDMASAAAFRGGRCLTERMKKGDLYTKIEWECASGHRFAASPYTILKAGHWCPECAIPAPWRYDLLAKSSPFFAQVWYDSHGENENATYRFDEQHVARYEVTK